jgi:hypothetical protein
MENEVEKRKDNTEKTMTYAKLLIDGQVVATSKKAPLNWPSYEADLLE